MGVNDMKLYQYSTVYQYSTEVSFEVLTFPGGEKHVRIDNNCYYGNGGPWIIICDTLDSNGIMTLLLLVDAIQRVVDTSIELTLKYFPYARQDRVAVRGESLSVKVMADLINSQKFSDVTIWDPHSDVTPALLNNVLVITQNSWYRKLVGRIGEIPALVSPDVGAIKKINSMGNPNVIIANKKRDVVTGKITNTELLNPIHKDLLGSTPLLVMDDICDGGRTFIELGKVLDKEYPDNKKYLFVTHGIFSNREQFLELTRIYSRIFCANFISTTIKTENFPDSLSLL